MQRFLLFLGATVAVGALVVSLSIHAAQTPINNEWTAAEKTYKVLALPNVSGPPGPVGALNNFMQYNGSGAQGGVRNTDAAPIAATYNAQSAYPQSTVNTAGAALHLGGGIGRKLAALTRANCSTDTFTVTINGTANNLVEGTDWNRGATDATAATALAAAINSLAKVSATSSGGTVYVQKDIADATGGATSIALSTSDGTCAAITSGTDGAVTMFGNMLGSGTWTNNANSLGWSVVAGANTACTTTCTFACMGGQDTGDANKPIVGCADATADLCFCAGAN